MFCLDQGVPLPRPAQAEVRLQASSPPERVGLQPHSQRATVASRTPMGSFEIRTLRPLSRKNESLSGTGTVTEATKVRLEAVAYRPGTDGSNPFPSSGESANPWHGLVVPSRRRLRKDRSGAGHGCNPR